MFLAGKITYSRCTLICCLPKSLSLQSHSPGASLPPTPLLGERGQCHLTSLRLSFFICRWRGSGDEIPCVNACVLTGQFSVHRGPGLSWHQVLWWLRPCLRCLPYLWLLCAISHYSSCIKLTLQLLCWYFLSRYLCRVHFGVQLPEDQG